MVVTHEVEVRIIQYDSRKVERGDAFVALRGSRLDGNRFIQDAIVRGAKVVVTDDDASLPDSFFMHAGVVKVVVQDSREALAIMSAAMYDYPAEKLSLIGVTGTNGKTTTTAIIRSLLDSSGKKTGLIGTIEYNVGGESRPASHTTPESRELQALFSEMVSNRCSAAVMEVSSHALDQRRVHGLPFDVAVFTNLTQDHLDYHGSMESYFLSKQRLFDALPQDAVAVINADDPFGKRLKEIITARTVTFGLTDGADVRATDISVSWKGIECSIRYAGASTKISSPLVGTFNVYNILAAFAAVSAMGIPEATIGEMLKEVKPVRGRFEQFLSPEGWVAVVDYAHTPDALDKTLRAILDLKGRGRVITVFGCGGNRDATKRPLMGAIASEKSDLTVVTSDNPRSEKPDDIIDDVMAGIVPGRAVIRESDRAAAIELALREAKRDDVVLIAGKGHEDYQIIGESTIHFSDREIVERTIRTRA